MSARHRKSERGERGKSVECSVRGQRAERGNRGRSVGRTGRGGAQTGKRRALLYGVAYAVRFFVVAAIITVAVFVQEAAAAAFGGDRGAIALIMLVCIVFLALALTVAELLVRRYTVERPVSRIADMVRRIAAGDFSVRADIAHPYGRYDAYDCILLDLNRAAEQLTAAQQAGDAFVSNVSHELKTPLAVILSYAQALEREQDAAARAEYLRVLKTTAEKLAELVRNVLRLNRLEHRKTGELADFSLNEQLAECIVAFEERIDEKGLSLVCDLDDVRVHSDMGCLELVWNNLLSNAVKFTDEGGVSVTLKKEGDHAVVTVSDTGCGISAETGRHIFEEFYQGDTSHAAEGNGLGLALVKKVISLLGGSVEAESEEDKGSTFRVVLPGAL